MEKKKICPSCHCEVEEILDGKKCNSCLMLEGLDSIRHLVGKELDDERWNALKRKMMNQAEERSNGQYKI